MAEKYKEVNIKLVIRCKECEDELEIEQDRWNDNEIQIKPCESCLNKAKVESHKEGFDEGYAQGLDGEED